MLIFENTVGIGDREVQPKGGGSLVPKMENGDVSCT